MFKKVDGAKHMTQDGHRQSQKLTLCTSYSGELKSVTKARMDATYFLKVIGVLDMSRSIF